MSVKINESLVLAVIDAKLNRPSKPIRKPMGVERTIEPTEKLTQIEWFNFIRNKTK